MASIAAGEVKEDTTPVPANWLDEMARHAATLLPESGGVGEDIDTVKFFQCMKERAGRVFGKEFTKYRLIFLRLFEYCGYFKKAKLQY